MATTMVIPLAAFGVWALIAVMGSIVASIIVVVLSWSNEKDQTSKDPSGLATQSEPSTVSTGLMTSTEATCVEEANKKASTDEENRHSEESKDETQFLETESFSENAKLEQYSSVGTNNFVETDQILLQHEMCSMNEYPFMLPPRRVDDPRHLTVVLDLDETLVRSCEDGDVPVELEFAASMGSLQRIEIQCEDPAGGPADRIMSFLRPGVFQFLDQLSRFAEVVVFTAGDPEYASPLVAQLDPERKIFVGSLYRSSTVKTIFHDHVKDLSCLGRDPRYTVLVDNNPFSFLYQPDNGILCEPFFGDPNDKHLMQAILPLLEALACVHDVRPYLRRR
eukprot:g6133.t1